MNAAPLSDDEFTVVCDVIEAILSDNDNDMGFFDTTSGGALAGVAVLWYRDTLRDAQRKLLDMRASHRAAVNVDAAPGNGREQPE